MRLEIDLPDERLEDVRRVMYLHTESLAGRLPESDEDEYNNLYEELGDLLVPLFGDLLRRHEEKEAGSMQHDVTIVVAEGDPEVLIDVVRGDARAALALFRAVRPNQDDYPGGTQEKWEDLPPSAEVQVRVYLAERGFETVPYVRAALTFAQLYE